MAILKRWVNIRIPRRFRADKMMTALGRVTFSRIAASCLFLLLIVVASASPLLAQTAKPRSHTAAKSNTAKSSKSSKPTLARGAIATSPSPSWSPAELQLAKLARALRDNSNAAAYEALSAFAGKNSKSVLGARAALALGYYDLSRDKAQPALEWLRKADGDTALREYVLYWRSQALLTVGEKEEGLAQLEKFRHDFPGGVMTEQGVTSLAQNALALGKPEEASAALEEYADTTSRPALLLIRAEAREKTAAARGEKPLAAAADYLDLYYRFPLNDEARAAGRKISILQPELGEAFPGTPMQTQIVRAETFFAAKRWQEAHGEYAALLRKLTGADLELAQLRMAQCDVQTGGRAEVLAALSLTGPEFDAERIYTISQAHRSQKLETQMLEEINDLATRFPHSPWVEEGLFAAGNYYWVNLDRAHAAEFYRRTVAAFPDGKNAPSAAWRVAWAAYLDRAPETADLLEAYVRRFPKSSYIQDALYWLGREYERSGKLSYARGIYAADATRFPLTYFGSKAAARIRSGRDGIGDAPANSADFLAVIPPAPALPIFDQALPVKILERQARAQALRDIAFDASAELEYRAAYAVVHSPRLLISAAKAAIAAGHYGIGIVTMRQVFPQLEARRISEIPNEAWRTAFPLPYELSVRSAAIRSQVDPMLLAGLIRQESAFEANAMSHAGAVGLMQVMPKTASKLARQLKVRYARPRLTDPGYNLQLGSRYLADLIQTLGTPEAALAAYNAGEERVAQWTTGQNYQEPAEFVESIPFTETREYVQIVIRNADVYRQVYDSGRAQEQAFSGAGSGANAADPVGRLKSPRGADISR